MAKSRSKVLVGAAILIQLLGVLTFAATLFAQELFWAKSPTGGAQGFGIAVDSSGNSYVTGTFSGTLTFAPGVTLTAVNLNDLFVAKYDGAGTAVWAASAGGVGPDAGRGIAVDGSGNSYVTGFRGGSDLFLAKYDSTGSLVWAMSVAGTGDDCSSIGQASCLVGQGIAVDSSGNSYVTGLFNGTAANPTIFGAGELNETPLISAGGTDIFVAKYDSAGKLVWAKRAGGTGDDQGGGIAVDGLGNSYVTGVGAITQANMFVAKYDSTGSLVWAKSASGNFQVGMGVALDGVGNTYVAGDYTGTATNPTIFGPGEPNQTQLISAGPGDRDVFLAKYDSNGNLVLAKRAGGGAGTENARGIALDSSGNSYVTGIYSGTATFGPGQSNQTQLTAAGASDIFVAQFDSTGSLVWVRSAGGSIDSTTQRDFGFGIDVDGSGNSYVTGRFQGTATNPAIFGSGEPNETQLFGTAGLQMFIAKFAGDQDGDNVSILLDNCPDVSNPTQSDIDGDRIGDACDPNSFAPVANNDSYSTNQNTPLTVLGMGFLANDTDADNNTLTVQAATNPNHAASFTLNSNGSFSYTPVTNYTGPDSFTYAAFDGEKFSNVATVTITVNAIDTTPPDTTITFKPLALTSNTTATFNFMSTEAGSSFACVLDSGTFTSCTSPQMYNALANGSHTFQVRATDSAGNTDQSPAIYTWTVDTLRTSDGAAPVLASFVIDTPAVDSGSGPATVQVTAIVQDDLSGVNFVNWSVLSPGGTTIGGSCSRTGGTALEGVYQCTAVLPQSSASGTWLVNTVFVRDTVGNARTYFTTDLTSLGFPTTFVNGPVADTTISSAPPALTNSTTATFTFLSNDPTATFECSLDGVAFISCSSPATYNSLAIGAHAFQVRAVNGAGNPDPTPASYNWTIVDGSGVVTVLHSFTGSGASGTGSNPFAGLIQGIDGNFYGTAVFGGVNNLGTIFRMDGNGVVTVLHSFTGSGASGTGSSPAAGLVQGSDGNFYGTTRLGGVNDLGTIFRMDGSGVVTVLHSFTGSGASGTGSNPFAGLIQGIDGNFYGTAVFGGVNNLGTIFRMDGSGVVTVLHSFTGSGASGTGSNPVASLVQGSDGNFYGTTRLGGVNDLGTIFRMDGSGVVTVLHSFTGSGASGTGSSPAAGLVQGSDGNFYGTAEGGGANSIGTIFRVNLSLPTDGTAPETTILTNPAALTNSTSATFTFTSTEAGTFECKLDSGSFAACSSPQTYNGLSEGNHSFQVRAKDLAGNTDQTPASFSWMIDIIPPGTTITSNPPATTNSTSATFEFTSTESGSTFACNLDGAGFTTCASPQTYNSLAGGNHNFQVRAIDAAGNFDTTPASYNWTITTADITPPETTITGNPAAVTTATTASFTFTSNEAGSTFQCRLDTAAFATCTSPRNFTGLAAGTHTFEVRATDTANNTDPSPASFTWMIDRTDPDTSITSNPPAATNSTSASFAFTSNEAGSTFQCRLDGAAFAACTSPISYSGLTVASHTFRVRAIDLAGNVDGSPAVYTWTIDATAPTTTITGNPPTLTNSTTATFTFTANQGGSTFACSLNGSAFTACTSPKTYSGLAAGSHTFQVRAIDPAGNPDPTPASFTWSIETTAPDTSITSNPPALSNTRSASFTFAATEAGSTFGCSLDGGAFTNCNSPRNYTGLADGSHTFQVRAIDPAGNIDSTPASYTWTVDATNPVTTITSNPPAATNSTSASFTFTSNEAGSTFECRLDGAAFAACTSPQNFTGLSAGNHTFRVRAIDSAGNVDGSLAAYTWNVDLTPPNTNITANPPATTTSTTATFRFTANQANSTFACRLDGVAFAACTSPLTYTGLTVGGHNFQVRATDPAGNTDPTPDSFTWTIQ